MKKIIGIIFFFHLCISCVFAANHEVNLVVAYKTVYFKGKATNAIAINNQIPGPTLHFKEGDRVTLNVYNQLDKETAIHWHGMLVPWQMDGVLGVAQKGIQPGKVFHYQFTLHQSGTYWYHAHAGLQEQQGLYGAFIIDPPARPAYQYNKDYVIVLSDWSNTNADQILANLKKDGDYYSPRFPLQPSLAKFITDYHKADSLERQNLIADYKMMQQMRMGLYDLSDVAYDKFLLNGHTRSNPWTAQVKIGDVVRLRFIGAGGSTIFHVKIPNTTMQMVHVEGNNVKPYTINDFTIAPGETYDVLVRIEKNFPYIIYAESRDKVGAAYGALVTSTHQLVNFKTVSPFPESSPVTREMMPPKQVMVSATKDRSAASSLSQSMKMDSGMMMHSGMEMPSSSETKYQNIIAAVKTNNPHKPVNGVIKMELFGYMRHYIWFINAVPEYNAKPIILDPSKRYRFVFINSSMMHHPMHIHGHWFILRKGEGAYDPLLHTIDVPPGATITADLDTDASGQWFFHCHLIYHMAAGMARVVQYSTLIDITKGEAKPQNIVEAGSYYNRPIVRVDEVRPIDLSLVKHPMAHQPGFWFSSFLSVGADPFHNVQRLTYKGLYGPDYHKLELLAKDAEVNKGKVDTADIDIFYWNLISQFWAIKGGVNYTYRPALVPYWQPGLGIEGLTPYFIDTDIRGYFYNGSAKLDIELNRDTQLTNNFFLRTGLRSIAASKSVSKAQIGVGLNQMRYVLRPYYRLMPGLDIFSEYEHEQDYGAYRKFKINAGDAAFQDTLSFGLSVLF